MAGVAGVQPQMREAREEADPRGFEQELDAIAIGDVRRVNLGHEYQTLGVYQKMTLSSLDLLGTVVTALFSSHARCLHRLGVHYGCARLRVPLQTHSHPLAQGIVHPLPGTIQAPRSKVVVDGLPWREVVWEQSPGTAAL